MQCLLRRCASVALVTALGACGGSQAPTEQEIWYTTSLRPGTVEPETQGERELLARMDEVPSNEPVRFAGQVFVVEPAYTAASGRSCRSVRVDADAVELKLACEQGAGWVFVPDVFAAEPEPAGVAAAPEEQRPSEEQP